MTKLIIGLKKLLSNLTLYIQGAKRSSAPVRGGCSASFFPDPDIDMLGGGMGPFPDIYFV